MASKLKFIQIHPPTGCRGWEPGDAELEEATLAVQLLAELAPARDLLQSSPQLQEAAYRLSTR